MAGRRKTSGPAEADGQPLAGESAAQHDFSLWVQTDFNYTTPPFATLTEGIPPSDLETLQNDFQSSLHQAYNLNSTEKRERATERGRGLSGKNEREGAEEKQRAGRDGL